MFLLGLIPLLHSPAAQAMGDDDPYTAFSRFCATYFGAEKEPETYRAFGETLSFDGDSLWLRPSHTSAAVGITTNLPADVHIEYGPTDALGEQTGTAERLFYTHLRHMTGLTPGRTYHYRFVATDERGSTIRSDTRTFTTRPPQPDRVIRIPDDMQGPPYILDQADAYYLVTRDLAIDGTAFEIPDRTTDVTLDLGGHTVTYNNKAWPDLETDNFPDWIRDAKYGIKAMKASGLKVYNGAIVQGPGANRAQNNSIGYNPIYLNGCQRVEIAGVTISYNGAQQIGIYGHWSGSRSSFHHNIFIDAGADVRNRHGAGSRALLVGADSEHVTVHHNLVKRTRQGGVRGSEVHHNEIYVDSWATNSFAITLNEGGVAHHNKVFGTGYHLVAFGWGHEQTFHHNFVHLEGTDVKGRFEEYGDQVSLNGFRLTQYNGATHARHDNLYHDNTVVIRGREGSQGRGTQFWGDPHVINLRFRDNVVKAITTDNDTPRIASIVAHGTYRLADAQEPVYYENAELISNICNVRFGDDYGVGSNTRFIGCRFVRVGDDPRYRTFNFSRAAISRHHVVRDPVFEGGASMDSIAFTSDEQDVTFEWTVTVKTEPNATIAVHDAHGHEVWQGRADEAGDAAVPLAQQTVTRAGTRVHTPHRIRTEAGDRAGVATVRVDRARSVTVPVR